MWVILYRFGQKSNVFLSKCGSFYIDLDKNFILMIAFLPPTGGWKRVVTFEISFDDSYESQSVMMDVWAICSAKSFA